MRDDFPPELLAMLHEDSPKGQAELKSLKKQKLQEAFIRHRIAGNVSRKARRKLNRAQRRKLEREQGELKWQK